MRIRYLRYGKRAFSKRKWTRYTDLNNRVRSAVDDLDEPLRTVAQLYYLRGLTQTAVGIQTYYSERHIRRLQHTASDIIVRT